MKTPRKPHRRRAVARVTKQVQPAADGAKDRLLVDLEMQRTRLQLQIESLQRLKDELDDMRRLREDFFQSVPIGYVTITERGLISEWNAAASELLDPKRKQLHNVPLTFFAVPEDIEIILDHLARCRHERGQVVSELRLRRETGERVPVQVLSRPFPQTGKRLFQTVLIDLTERRKNEHAVAEAREFSDAIIQTIHEPLLVLESGLRIIRINEAFRKMFQLPLRAARGLSLSSVLNLWRSGNELRQRLEQALIDNVALSDFEFEVFPRKLGRRIFRFNARPLFQEQPARTPAPLLLVALEDITARKQAEEELAESNKQLQQLNDELERRVEERTHQLSESNKQLESFCYSIAHDLRGPLRAVAGFGAALMDDFASKLGEQGADYANRIVHAAQQMDELIRDLLEYGRFNTINLAPAPVDAEEVLSHVLDNLQTSIQEKHARIERKGRLPTVMGHRVVLEAAFSNLLSNGLKFVPPGNTPEVTIWPEEQEREVRIWFADNGIGIDPQHQKRIFEVFQRLHSQKVYPGTGIGLAIVQTAVQRIGGQVGVESEPGKGSRFWVSLPKPGPRSAQAA